MYSIDTTWKVSPIYERNSACCTNTWCTNSTGATTWSKIAKVLACSTNKGHVVMFIIIKRKLWVLQKMKRWRAPNKKANKRKQILNRCIYLHIYWSGSFQTNSPFVMYIYTRSEMVRSGMDHYSTFELSLSKKKSSKISTLYNAQLWDNSHLVVSMYSFVGEEGG